MPRNDYSSSQLASVLMDIQNGSCSHSKCLDRLIALHYKDSERFKRDFAGHINRILVVAGDKRDINIEKLVNLVIDFVSGRTGTEEDSNYKRHQFAIFAIQHLLDKICVKDKAVRFRGTQILSGILQCMSNDIEIDATLQETITDKMLERVRDKQPAIRIFAISCLSCFQMNIAVMEEFSRVMDFDANKEVRKAALTHIRVSKHTLSSILRRTRDVKDDIRALAFEILTKKVRPEKLTSRQLCDTVIELLQDKSQASKDVSAFKNWIALRFGNDIMQLCAVLDVENNETVAEEALKKIFSATSLASPLLLTNSDITKVNSFYWRIFCEHLKKEKMEAALDEGLPTLSEYCDILRDTASSEHLDRFVLKQLLLGCSLFDIADEVGRAKLTSLLGGMLTTAPVDMLDLVTKNLFIVESEGAECIRLMVESISELMDPLEEDDEIKKLKEQLSDLQVRQQQKKNPKEIASIKKIEKELQENEHKTWMRCCTITGQLLENINKGLNNPMIAGLFHSVILPSVKYKSPDIRNMGLKLLGLFCLFDKEMALSHVPIFIQAVSRDSDDVKVTSVKILFDFLLAYNLDNQTLQDSQQASPAAQSIQRFLHSHLSSSHDELKTTAVEGFAKLMLADVVMDKKILSQLLEQLYSPQTAELPRLRKCLHVFIRTYLHSKVKAVISVRSKLFRKAVFGALNTFSRSPSSLDLPFMEVATYLINLLRLGSGKDDSPMEEHKLAVKLFRLFQTDPNGGIAALNLSKALRILRLDNSNQDELQILKKAVEKILPSIQDKVVSANVEKFVEMVQAVSPTKGSPAHLKPLEPASPSPPASPYFTESPGPGPTPTIDDVPPVLPKPDIKTPVSKKQRIAEDKQKALGDFITQQKRAFAELDENFSLEVEVTPKRPKTAAAFAGLSASKATRVASTPKSSIPVAPNTVPRSKTGKRVSFDVPPGTSMDIPSYEGMPHKSTAAAETKVNTKRKSEGTSGSKAKKSKTSTKKPGYVLSFTGFKGQEELAMQTDLEERAKNLNMKCYTSDVFDSSVTHVVVPHGRNTMKTMTARLAGLWIVEPKWLEDSAKAGRILPEFKSFAFAPNFVDSVPRSTIHNCKTFISLARGTVIDDCGSADYVLIPDEQTASSFAPAETLTTKQFFSVLSS